jgi:hypothetical protein
MPARAAARIETRADRPFLVTWLRTTSAVLPVDFFLKSVHCERIRFKVDRFPTAGIT